MEANYDDSLKQLDKTLSDAINSNAPVNLDAEIDLLQQSFTSREIILFLLERVGQFLTTDHLSTSLGNSLISLLLASTKASTRRLDTVESAETLVTHISSILIKSETDDHRVNDETTKTILRAVDLIVQLGQFYCINLDNQDGARKTDLVFNVILPLFSGPALYLSSDDEWLSTETKARISRFPLKQLVVLLQRCWAPSVSQRLFEDQLESGLFSHHRLAVASFVQWIWKGHAPAYLPQVYHPELIFRQLFLFGSILIENDSAVVQEKAVGLCLSALRRIDSDCLTDNSIDEGFVRTGLDSLKTLAVYSAEPTVRSASVKVLMEFYQKLVPSGKIRLVKYYLFGPTSDTDLHSFVGFLLGMLQRSVSAVVKEINSTQPENKALPYKEAFTRQNLGQIVHHVTKTIELNNWQQMISQTDLILALSNLMRLMMLFGDVWRTPTLKEDCETVLGLKTTCDVALLNCDVSDQSDDVRLQVERLCFVLVQLEESMK